MTPLFVKELRKYVGHKRLQLVSVSGVAINDKKILLQQRTDSRNWATISGVVEPNEQPAETLRREFFEETGARIDVLDLVSLYVEPEQKYFNGDVVQFLNITFLVKLLDIPCVNDLESVDVQWYPLNNLPLLSIQNERRIKDCLIYKGRTIFHYEDY